MRCRRAWNVRLRPIACGKQANTPFSPLVGFLGACSCFQGHAAHCLDCVLLALLLFLPSSQWLRFPVSCSYICHHISHFLGFSSIAQPLCHNAAHFSDFLLPAQLCVTMQPIAWVHGCLIHPNAWVSCCFLISCTMQPIAWIASLLHSPEVSLVKVSISRCLLHLRTILLIAPSGSLLGPVAACSAHFTIQTHCLDFLLMLISSLASSRPLLGVLVARLISCPIQIIAWTGCCLLSSLHHPDPLLGFLVVAHLISWTIQTIAWISCVC